MVRYKYDFWQGGNSCKLAYSDAKDYLSSLKEDSVDLIIGSPPYFGKLDRYSGLDTNMDDWLGYMADSTELAVKASAGFVIWVINGPYQGKQYYPICEALSLECHRRGIVLERPCIWYKNAVNARSGWFRNCWEYVQIYTLSNKKRTFNYQEVGSPPKYSRGGKYKQRNEKGKVVEGGDYPQNKIVKPEDVLRVTVGGGHMGSKFSSKNEAPYPEKLPRYFIKLLTNKGDKVSDCFLGSGTTAAVAIKEGRHFDGSDLRQEQIDVSYQRIIEEC